MFAYESQATETVAPPNHKRGGRSSRTRKRILFVSNSNGYGGAEKHLLDLVHRLRRSGVLVSILCLGMDFFSERLGPNHGVEVIIRKKAPRSLWDWVCLFRAVRSDVVVFVYGWFWAIPSGAVIGAWLAGVQKRFSIQHLMTPPVPVPPQVWAAVRRRRSMRGILRRLLGRKDPPWMADLPLCMIASMSSPAQLRRSAYFFNTTICVSNALRDSLVKAFGFPARKLKTISMAFPSQSSFLLKVADPRYERDWDVVGTNSLLCALRG